MPTPFRVLETQNFVDQEGIYPRPKRSRFMHGQSFLSFDVVLHGLLASLLLRSPGQPTPFAGHRFRRRAKPEARRSVDRRPTIARAAPSTQPAEHWLGSRCQRYPLSCINSAPLRLRGQFAGSKGRQCAAGRSGDQFEADDGVTYGKCRTGMKAPLQKTWECMRMAVRDWNPCSGAARQGLAGFD